MRSQLKARGGSDEGLLPAEESARARFVARFLLRSVSVRGTPGWVAGVVCVLGFIDPARAVSVSGPEISMLRGREGA